MGYQIRIVPEVEAWLANLRASDEEAASLVDEAMTALRAGGDSVGAPMVVPVADLPGVPPEDLDATYQRQLEMLTFVRRASADVATARKRVELQIEQLNESATRLADQARVAREAGRDEVAGEAARRRAAVADRLEDLDPRYAELLAEESHMAAASQRLQAKVDDFRVRKEAAKATWTAANAVAEAERVEELVDEALAEVAQAHADGESGTRPRVGPTGVHPHVVPLRLSELRPGAPERMDMRILFTVDEPDTAVLLAAATEDDILQAWYARARLDGRIRYRRYSGG